MNLKYLLNPSLLCSLSLAPCLMLAADPQGSPSVRPPFLIRADQDQIADQVHVHSQDNAVPSAADFTAGLLTSAQTGLIARPAIEMVKALAGAKPGDYTVDLRIEALMPFGESNADLLYKGTTIDLLRFSRPGVAVGPADGTTIIARETNPLLLVLDNHSAFTYKEVAARLRFQDHDFCAFEVGAPQATPPKTPIDCATEKSWNRFSIPQYAQVTLRATSLPAEWFQDPGSTYARSGKSTGTLTLHFADSSQSTPRIHEQSLPIEAQFEAGTRSFGFTLLRIFGLLALGAGISFLLRVSLPNMKRKRALKDQLAEINKQIPCLSGEVGSRLRTMLGSEWLALDELRKETFPIAPNYAEYAKRVDQGMPILSRKVAVAQRLQSALELHRALVNAGYAYKMLDDSERLIYDIARQVQKNVLSDDDWQALNQALQRVETILDKPDQDQDAVVSALALRWQALREHFGPRDAASTLIKGPWSPPQAVQDMKPVFDSLPKEFYAADLDEFKRWSKGDDGTGGNADLLVSSLEYVTFAETIVTPNTVSQIWKEERDKMPDLLANVTTRKLFDVRDAQWRLAENIFKDDVKKALTLGQARLVVDPENPAENQRFRVSVRLPDPHLDESTARDQLNCRWTFTTTMQGSRILYKPWSRASIERVKHEQGWHAFHYFENGSVNVDISIEVFDGSDMVELGSNPRGEFPYVKVMPAPNWTLRERYARTILEMAQLAAALLIPLAALASSTVNGGGEGRWWTLVVLGFGTDTIKNIISGKDDTPAVPPGK
jgi:hypothetical protein